MAPVGSCRAHVYEVWIARNLDIKDVPEQTTCQNCCYMSITLMFLIQASIVAILTSSYCRKAYSLGLDGFGCFRLLVYHRAPAVW